MKGIFIKYNPFILKTEIWFTDSDFQPSHPDDVDSVIEEIKNSGALISEKFDDNDFTQACKDGSHLQEWVYKLPEFLINTLNTNKFCVVFHGTNEDFNDLNEVLTGSDAISCELFHKAVFPDAKLKELDNLYQDILSSDVVKNDSELQEELANDRIKNYIEQIKNSFFEITVMAPMSAGKSTLLNVLLRKDLMPSKQGACTAIISKLYDEDCNWKGSAYDKKGNILPDFDNIDLNLEVMKKINSNENIATLEAEGNISFYREKNAQAQGVKLVLIDTPGPNNAADPNHKKITYDFLQKSSKSLVLYVMNSQYNTNDSDDLIKKMVETVKEAQGESRIKDRFLFVVNSIDERNPDEDEPVESLISDIRSFLRKQGLEKVNIFPISALFAKLLNKVLNKEVLTRNENHAYTKFISDFEDDFYFLEKYSSLPPLEKKRIDDRLKEIEDNLSHVSSEDEKNKLECEKFLIHSGITSLERAISLYVNKYAYTEKVKQFHGMLEARVEGVLNNANELIKVKAEELDKVNKEIASAREKYKALKDFSSYKEDIDSSIKKVERDFGQKVTEAITKLQSKLTPESNRNEEISQSEARQIVATINDQAMALQPQIVSDLDEIINDSFAKTCSQLLQNYQSKLKEITDEVNLDASFKIDTSNLLSKNFDFSNVDISALLKVKKVEDGRKWVENTEKRWWKPWTWFAPSGHWVTKYKNVEFIERKELFGNLLTIIQEGLYDDADAAKDFAFKKLKQLSSKFELLFKELNELMDKKLNNLNSITANQESLEKAQTEAQKRLPWLEELMDRLNAIVRI